MNDENLKEITLSNKSKLFIIENAIPENQSNKYLHSLINGVSWYRDRYNFNGKITFSPRLIDYQGLHNYRYSGINHSPKPYHYYVSSIVEIIASLCEQNDINIDGLNGCVLNYYRNGHDSISMHSDDEPCLILTTPIVGVSLGATRKMVFRSKITNKTHGVCLPNGSIYIMYGRDFQKEFLHGVPKELHVRDPRVSLTFRNFKGV